MRERESERKRLASKKPWACKEKTINMPRSHCRELLSQIFRQALPIFEIHSLHGVNTYQLLQQLHEVVHMPEMDLGAAHSHPGRQFLVLAPAQRAKSVLAIGF